MAIESKDYYNSCNLKSNPFRQNPSQEADPRMDIWVGYEKEKKQLVKYLTRCLAGQVGSANFLMTYGELGTGKSHALLWAKHQIMQAQKEKFNAVAYYIQTLKKDSGKISFSAAFKDDIIGKSNIINDVLWYKQFLDNCIVEYKTFKGYGPDKSKESALSELIPSIELFNFAKDILRCEFEANVTEVLLPKGLTDYKSMTILTTLINLFVLEIEFNSTVNSTPTLVCFNISNS